MTTTSHSSGRGEARLFNSNALIAPLNSTLWIKVQNNMRRIISVLFTGIVIGASSCFFYLKFHANNNSNYLRVGDIQQNYEILLKENVKNEIDSKFKKGKNNLSYGEEDNISDFRFNSKYEIEVAKLEEDPNNTYEEKLNEIIFTVFSDKYLPYVRCTAVDKENVKTGSSDIFSIDPPYSLEKIHGVNFEVVDKILCYELHQEAYIIKSN